MGTAGISVDVSGMDSFKPLIDRLSSKNIYKTKKGALHISYLWVYICSMKKSFPSYEGKKEGRIINVPANRVWWSFGLVLITGIIIGGTIGSVIGIKKGEIFTERRNSQKYRYISPLLECDSNLGEKSIELRSLESILERYVQKEENLSIVDSVGIYYRDLNNGPWFGINENEPFLLASLTKVPLAMTVYKYSEIDPSFLEKLIEDNVDKKDVRIQTVVPSIKTEDGKTYTIEELVERMIKYSDNEAQLMVAREVALRSASKIFQDLGIKIGEDDGEIELSPRSYSSFFRILYNASYLNEENSEKMLKILGQSEYKDGLAAGLPEDLTVSHKFGERIRENNGSVEFQLHDCGVVYRPGAPYLICVMTRGRDSDYLAEVIAEISRIIYSYLVNN